ncbi:MAG: 50S ribosomal protein L21 [Nitrospirae bacterium]|nr:50S ribosomal protein L21 [Nitrospirota bacterium]
MYAVIETGGKQYRVSEGSVLAVEKLPQGVGEMVEFSRVLMVGGASGVNVGSPVVSNAKVTAEVLRQFRDKKVLVFKKKRRKNYRKMHGHRQSLTTLRVTKIEG